MTGLTVKLLQEWSAGNQCFYDDFRHWLQEEATATRQPISMA